MAAVASAGMARRGREPREVDPGWHAPCTSSFAMGSAPTSTTRRTAVAGSFYPADRSDLARVVHGLLAGVDAQQPVPEALVAPHAGYAYSGPIAALAYAQLEPVRHAIERVVLLGPSHRVPFWGVSVTGATWWETPLGRVPIDRDGQAAIAHLPQVRHIEVAHEREHSLEVQLPFLQVVLGTFRLVPLVVGEASPDEITEVLEPLWGGPETLVVVSSDLSHDHDYETARAMDEETSGHVVRLEWNAIDPEHACGVRPLNGLLLEARRRALRARVLDLGNSGDTSGDRGRVVGYGAWAFSGAPGPASGAPATSGC